MGASFKESFVQSPEALALEGPSEGVPLIWRAGRKDLLMGDRATQPRGVLIREMTGLKERARERVAGFKARGQGGDGENLKVWRNQVMKTKSRKNINLNAKIK